MIDVDRPKWMSDGLCNTGDQVLNDMFFPARGQATHPAKEICAKCPVREECLDYAITEYIKNGIWGGMSERERRVERVRRRAEGTLSAPDDRRRIDRVSA